LQANNSRVETVPTTNATEINQNRTKIQQWQIQELYYDL